MRQLLLPFLIIIIAFYSKTAYGQSLLLAKSIDTTHYSTVAILRVDSSGKALVAASGVLIHPQVVLTAGHVNFRLSRFWSGGWDKKGFISIGSNAYKSDYRIPFDWINDVESHPDTAFFFNSFDDTTKRTNPLMFIDIGLIFLNRPVENCYRTSLPDSFALTHRKPGDLLVSAGFGYDKSMDSMFQSNLVDGRRRHWRLDNIELTNNLWISTECSNNINFRHLGMFDSGAPLFLNDNIVVGIWSWINGNPPKNCTNILEHAVRLDSPKVLKWIKERIKKRIGIDLK